MKIFVRATYEKAPSSYFNKLYVASGKDIDECRLKLLEQGCTEYLDKDLNLGTHTTTTKSQVVLLGYRSYAVNEEAIRMKTTAAAKAAERESQMNQAIYDIVCTVGEPYHPEGFLSQKYQLYYAPVIYTYKDHAGNTLTTGVDLNEGTTGPEIYMYYCSPYAAKEYNNRAKLNPNARFSSLPTDYIASPITEICLARYDRIPYDTEVDASSQDGQSTEKNVLRWEYVMQANSKKHVDLNEGAAAFEANSYDAIDNRVTMFVQRENGIPKEGAEITGGYTSERENFGQVKNYK